MENMQTYNISTIDHRMGRVILKLHKINLVCIVVEFIDMHQNI